MAATVTARYKKTFRVRDDSEGRYNGRMALTTEDVRKVGTLARLALSGDEIATITPQLNDLLNQFASLQQLDTTGVVPTSHAVPVTALLRDDVILPSLSQAEVLALTAHTDELMGGFIVPQVLGGD
jgi:aspartyl-tRNA(Asn)/glutamyl-tRNA(Gln) amidotransferase subunit C